MKGYKRQIIGALVVISCFLVAMIVYTFVSFFDIYKDSTEELGRSNIAYETSIIDNYLQKGRDILWVTADTVNNMMENGASNQDILDYLTAEAEHQTSQVDENFTGIYGYINGEYLDGIGWEPPEDYIPQARDWYTAAIEGKGKTVIVAPYLDAQTNTIMISVSQVLSDGKSVVSLDIALNEIQTIAENIKMNGMGYGFIIDNDGLVIAHYDGDEKGKVYPKDKDQEAIIRRILSGQSEAFTMKVDGEECTIFTDTVMDSWHVVMIVSNTKLFHDVRERIFYQALVCLLVFILVAMFCGIAYKNVRRHRERDLLISKKFDELNTNIVKALAYTIDAKDRYTSGHSQRVANYSLEIAKRMGKDEREQQEIYYAGLLHDVGKIRVPEDVINKPGKLTDEEFNQIKIHPVSGYHILKDIYDSKTIAVGAKYHHERYNGTGYPNGLAGNNIPEVARIIGVADAYDAMASNRSYRDALPQAVVRKEIEKGKGQQFDPAIAEIMLEMIDEDRSYSMCQLDNIQKSILVIDDERVNLIVAKGILKQEAVYDIYTAKTFESAMKILDEQKIDLILLDLMMPDIDGFEAYKQIKSKHDIPVVFMTADKSIETIMKAIELHVDDYITKPFLPNALKETVHGIVNSWS